MQVLFSTGALYGFPYPVAFRLAADAGCDGVELVLDPWSVVSGPAAVSKCARRLGTPVRVLHPSLFGLPAWKGPAVAFRRLGEWALAVGASALLLLVVWMVYRLAMPILIERMSA